VLLADIAIRKRNVTSNDQVTYESCQPSFHFLRRALPSKPSASEILKYESRTSPPNSWPYFRV